ncbi:ParB/RepB/Spo0J family partition protein [Diaminobutyricibacter sp. McL0618]|uniref:ParB/RepB/Spo0J family partition protein n=1 Tax=Leifsonia sp. McL0618 TaxID=3415677 RepID=UPI003CEAB79F
MSNTTRKTPARTANEPADLAGMIAAGAVTIEIIDVATAQLDPNVRTDTSYSAEFAESIKTDGVQEPVYARRDTDGTIYIWDGQRRTLAAKEAGIGTMLGIFGLTPASAAASKRILDQLRTFNRSNLPLSDRITAYEQLAFDGISESAIARAAGESRDRVKQSLTVAKSDSAKQAAIDHGQLSLDKLILIAEFDGDPDAAQRIALTEDDDDLAYVAQEIRDDRAVADRTATLAEKFSEDGVTVFTEWAGFRSLRQLTDAADDADDRRQLTADTHTGCEGRAVYLSVWGTGDNDYRVEDVCAQPDRHHELWAASGHQRTSSAPVEETEEDQATRERAEAATRKAERARVVRHNKAWRTAATVRRDWITQFLTRKTLPKDSAVFVALSLTEHAQSITDYKAGDLVGRFLGITEDYFARTAAAKLVATAPTRAGHVALAVALSAREARADDVDTWRHPSTVVGSYLLQLEVWGYKPAPVERIAAGYPESPDTDEQTTDADDEAVTAEPAEPDAAVPDLA